MADWSTISNLATGGGTLVLAVATFGSVRSANRSARVAETALLHQMRPVLMPSRLEDSVTKIAWGDEHFAKLRGGYASVEIDEGNIYLAFPLRNSGNGVAVLQSWQFIEQHHPAVHAEWGELTSYTPHTRDLYIAPGDQGFWQTGLRDPEDPTYIGVRRKIERRERFSIDLLYSDHEGGQRALSRFLLFPLVRADGVDWLVSLSRHRNLDHRNPR